MNFGHGGAIVEPSRAFLAVIGDKKSAKQKGLPSPSRQITLGLFLRPQTHQQLPGSRTRPIWVACSLLRREIELPGRTGRKEEPSAIC